MSLMENPSIRLCRNHNLGVGEQSSSRAWPGILFISEQLFLLLKVGKVGVYTGAFGSIKPRGALIIVVCMYSTTSLQLPGHSTLLNPTTLLPTLMGGIPVCRVIFPNTLHVNLRSAETRVGNWRAYLWWYACNSEDPNI